MIESILGALVGAGATALLGFLGWLFIRLSNRSEKQQNRKEMLEHIYSPLKAVFIAEYTALAKNVFEVLDVIVKKHYSLVDQVLIEWHTSYLEMKRLDMVGENSPVSRELAIHIISNYNWLKKCLKLPYDKEEIHAKYLIDYASKKKRIILINSIILGLLTGLFAFSSSCKHFGLLDRNLCTTLQAFSFGWFISYWVQHYFENWDKS